MRTKSCVACDIRVGRSTNSIVVRASVTTPNAISIDIARECRRTSFIQSLLQLRRPTAANRPGMLVKQLARRVPQRSRTRSVSPVGRSARRSPTRPVPALDRRASLGSPRIPITVRMVAGHGLPVPREENHRRRAVPGNVGPARVDDVGQIDSWEELLDQLLAELPLHEAVGRDLPRETALHRERDDAFQERHGQRILPVARRVSLPIRLRSAPRSLGVMYGGFATTA